MRILHVTCSAQPQEQTGVAQVIHHLIIEQRLKGHEVEVFTLVTHPLRPHQEEDVIQYAGYPIHRVNLLHTLEEPNNAYTETGYRNPDSIPALEKCMQGLKPDIVHFHAIQGMGANMIETAKKAGSKVVVSMHDWWWLAPCFFLADSKQISCKQKEINIKKCSQCIRPIREDAESFLLQRRNYLVGILKEHVDCIIAVSDYLKTYLIANHIPEEKIKVNKNGVELPKKGGRAESTPIVFGFLGGMMAIKGYEKLIKACAQLKNDNWHLHIYGCVAADKEGAKKVLSYIKALRFKELFQKLWQSCKSRMDRNKCISYHPVFFEGEKDEVYSKINVLLSVSQCKESSSLVVREALIRGIPVITTPSGGTEEVVVDGINGIVLKDDKVSTLVEAMQKMLDETYYNGLKQKMLTRPYVYTYKEQAAALEKIYTEVICKEGMICV